MMTSGYNFPIFISSTVYNLQDLRGELSAFLKETGYRPILSSSDAFPDSSPDLEPWESCLPVLGEAFIMVLVMDGKYGRSLPWQNLTIPPFKDFVRDKVSPTHGEYLFAQSKGRRMMVFVRNELMAYYQSYRKALKTTKSREGAKKLLKKILPDHIDFEALEFLHEVKTTKPIPWINVFENVTTVKKEVQNKMVNYLAETFMQKEENLNRIIKSFEEVMEGLSSEEQDEILAKVNSTKDFPGLKKKVEELKKEKEALEQKLDNSAESSQTIAKLNTEIEVLKSALSEQDNQLLVRKGGKIKFNSEINRTPFDSRILPQFNKYFGSDKCEGFKCEIRGETFLVNTRRCSSCNRNLCEECWPNNGSISYLNLCQECKKKDSPEKQIFFN